MIKLRPDLLVNAHMIVGIEAVAYNEAYKIMKAELQRLRNLLQNGSLTQADFGDDLPY